METPLKKTTKTSARIDIELKQKLTKSIKANYKTITEFCRQHPQYKAGKVHHIVSVKCTKTDMWRIPVIRLCKLLGVVHPADLDGIEINGRLINTPKVHHRKKITARIKGKHKRVNVKDIIFKDVATEKKTAKILYDHLERMLEGTDDKILLNFMGIKKVDPVFMIVGLAKLIHSRRRRMELERRLIISNVTPDDLELIKMCYSAAEKELASKRKKRKKIKKNTND